MTSERTKKRQKVPVSKRLASSWQVFMSCVTYEADGSANVSNIFSNRGFQLWLNTREEDIKHPAQSYQRVLYAHIRGADKRKPFPESVERALLLKLRYKKEGNPWSEVFGETAKQVGKRGFRQQGYHEQRRGSQPASSSIFPQPRLDPPKDIELNAEKVKQFPKSEEKPNEKTDVALRQMNPFRIAVSNQVKVTPYDMVMHAFDRCLPFPERKIIMKAAFDRGVPVTSPALIYLLSQTLDSSDLVYNLNFLTPPPEQQRFRPTVDKKSKVGLLCFSNSWICCAEDQEAIEIMNGSMLGKHALEMGDNLVSDYLAKVRELDILYGSSHVLWRRWPMKRADGTRGVFLVRTEPQKYTEVRGYMHFQEITDQFPQALSRISLI